MERWKRKGRDDWNILSRKVARIVEKLREVIFVIFFGVNLFVMDNCSKIKCSTLILSYCTFTLFSAFKTAATP